MSKDETAVKIFLGRIPKHVVEQNIREIVESYGEILDIAIVKDRASGESKGCAFVTFGSLSAADTARIALHGTSPFQEGQIQASFAKGEAERLGLPESVINGGTSEVKLFVGGLPRNNFTESDVRDLFDQFGDVTYIKMFNTPDGQFKGAGFVTLAQRDGAFKAIDSLHQKHIIPPMERPIQVKIAEHNKNGGNANGGNNQGHNNNQSNFKGGYPQQQPAYGGNNYGMQQQYSQNPRVAQPPPPPMNTTVGDWTEYFTPEGRAYYHNARQNITQWEKPMEFQQGFMRPRPPSHRDDFRDQGRYHPY